MASNDNRRAGHSIWYTQCWVRFDYTTVGHVTADVTADGDCQPGGSAFYSALQAARLGKRALIITRGVASELEELLAPYRDELALEIQEAPCTTSLATSGKGHERAQQVLAWAGAMDAELTVDTAVLHLAPIARETANGWCGEAGFVGLTPQGLLRRWSSQNEQIVLEQLDRSQLPERYDAAVISALERPFCAALLDGHAVIAVTDEAGPTELLLAAQAPQRVDVPAVERMREDLGAGDVFAAAFFIGLADGKDPLRSATFANAAASLRVSGYGPAAVPTRAAIATRLSALG
ncbi:MAG TPA: PfkB family carbohydrate kinase [Solirubrobacteraceae bacterium]